MPVLPIVQLAAATSLPQLDESNGFARDIEAVDTCGARHALTYKSAPNGPKGRMWLLEGLREVQAKYRIGLGDVLVFRCRPPPFGPGRGHCCQLGYCSYPLTSL